MNLLETLLPTSKQSARDLFQTARWCNSWAKQTEASTQRTLYRIKNACLWQLQNPSFEKSVSVRGDSDRHRGLLSLALASDPKKRLHTHENWRPAA